MLKAHNIHIVQNAKDKTKKYTAKCSCGWSMPVYTYTEAQENGETHRRAVVVIYDERIF